MMNTHDDENNKSDSDFQAWDGLKAIPTEISPETKNAYRARFISLRARYSKKNGYIVDNDELVFLLIADREKYAMRSWRYLKAAVMFSLRENPALNRDAIALLDSVSSKGLKKESDKGTGKRLKNIPSHIASEIVFNLLVDDSLGKTKRKYSIDAANILLATIETGLRPSEWVEALIYESTGESNRNEIILHVKNGKYNSFRGNGPYREIYITDLEDDKIKTIGETIKLFRDNALRVSDYAREINREIKRSLDELVRLGRIHKRYARISLYSARHQFIADAKSAKLPFREVAALAGQRSQKTASWHYARSAVGKGSVSVRPTPESINNVNAFEPSTYSPEHISHRNP